MHLTTPTAPTTLRAIVASQALAPRFRSAADLSRLTSEVLTRVDPGGLSGATCVSSLTFSSHM